MRLQKLRREGSNLRPSGYEPDELPLLYFAIWGAKVRQVKLAAKLLFILAAFIFSIVIATPVFYTCPRACVKYFTNSRSLVVDIRPAACVCI